MDAAGRDPQAARLRLRRLIGHALHHVRTTASSSTGSRLTQAIQTLGDLQRLPLLTKKDRHRPESLFRSLRQQPLQAGDARCGRAETAASRSTSTSIGCELEMRLAGGSRARMVWPARRRPRGRAWARRASGGRVTQALRERIDASLMRRLSVLVGGPQEEGSDGRCRRAVPRATASAD